jgi:DNA replication and repair protein RecF
VLEAVHALATGSSFRTTTAGDMVRTNSPLAEAHGVLFQDERRVQIDLTLTRGVRGTTKRMLVNGQRPTSRAVLAEFLPLTVFTPEGVEVVRGGPDQRRTFLNTLLADVDPSTGDILERFARALQQRNALLRGWQGVWPSKSALEELEVWNNEFVNAASPLLEARHQLLALLTPLLQELYHALAGVATPVALGYEASWQGMLGSALQQTLRDDIYRGYTTVGPHRDDFTLQLDGRDARRQASQGEQRSLALALRLAGHHTVHTQRGIAPLLLLDDVFSELDPARCQRLLSLLPHGQTLVTTASPLPNGMNPAAVFDISKGN